MNRTYVIRKGDTRGEKHPRINYRLCPVKKSSSGPQLFRIETWTKYEGRERRHLGVDWLDAKGEIKEGNKKFHEGSATHARLHPLEEDGIPIDKDKEHLWRIVLHREQTINLGGGSSAGGQRRSNGRKAWRLVYAGPDERKIGWFLRTYDNHEVFLTDPSRLHNWDCARHTQSHGETDAWELIDSSRLPWQHRLFSSHAANRMAVASINLARPLIQTRAFLERGNPFQIEMLKKNDRGCEQRIHCRIPGSMYEIHFCSKAAIETSVSFYRVSGHLWVNMWRKGVHPEGFNDVKNGAPVLKRTETHWLMTFEGGWPTGAGDHSDLRLHPSGRWLGGPPAGGSVIFAMEIDRDPNALGAQLCGQQAVYSEIKGKSDLEFPVIDCQFGGEDQGAIVVPVEPWDKSFCRREGGSPNDVDLHWDRHGWYEYAVHVPCDAFCDFRIHFASDELRYIHLLINGELVDGAFCGPRSGGEDPTSKYIEVGQVPSLGEFAGGKRGWGLHNPDKKGKRCIGSMWSFVGPHPMKAGTNIVRLQCERSMWSRDHRRFPHLDRMEIHWKRASTMVKPSALPPLLTLLPTKGRAALGTARDVRRLGAEMVGGGAAAGGGALFNIISGAFGMEGAVALAPASVKNTLLCVEDRGSEAEGAGDVEAVGEAVPPALHDFEAKGVSGASLRIAKVPQSLMKNLRAPRRGCDSVIVRVTLACRDRHRVQWVEFHYASGRRRCHGHKYETPRNGHPIQVWEVPKSKHITAVRWVARSESDYKQLVGIEFELNNGAKSPLMGTKDGDQGDEDSFRAPGGMMVVDIVTYHPNWERIVIRDDPIVSAAVSGPKFWKMAQLFDKWSPLAAFFPRMNRFFDGTVSFELARKPGHFIVCSKELYDYLYGNSSTLPDTEGKTPHLTIERLCGQKAKRDLDEVLPSLELCESAFRRACFELHEVVEGNSESQPAMGRADSFLSEFDNEKARTEEAEDEKERRGREKEKNRGKEKEHGKKKKKRKEAIESKALEAIKLLDAQMGEDANDQDLGAAADEVAAILRLWRERGVLLMDEVDLLLHPLKSELNFPIGQKKPIDVDVQSPGASGLERTKSTARKVAVSKASISAWFPYFVVDTDAGVEKVSDDGRSWTTHGQSRNRSARSEWFSKPGVYEWSTKFTTATNSSKNMNSAVGVWSESNHHFAGKPHKYGCNGLLGWEKDTYVFGFGQGAISSGLDPEAVEV